MNTGDPGIEPGNDGVKVRCLTAWLIPNETWCRREDLNPQPTDYKSVALPVELRRQILMGVGIMVDADGIEPPTLCL